MNKVNTNNLIKFINKIISKEKQELSNFYFTTTRFNDVSRI